jgi:hypothetical protein
MVSAASYPLWLVTSGPDHGIIAAAQSRIFGFNPLDADGLEGL